MADPGMADRESMHDALKTVATALKAADVRFALAGGYAGWARGGPESRHDVDFVVHDLDRGEAREALSQVADVELVPAPEDWLFKVGVNGVTVDIIHRLPFGPVDDALLGRASELSVESVRMPVLAATDLVLARLLALTEHSCDFSPLLSLARSVREQVDWKVVAQHAASNPFARAFLGLVADLGIVDERWE